MSCGIACLRMVEEFLSGSAQSEERWLEMLSRGARPDWDEVNGIRPSKLLRRLERLAGERGGQCKVLASFEDGARAAPSVPSGGVVVVLIDSPAYRGHRLAGNFGHYVVVHEIVDLGPPMQVRPRRENRRLAAVYHDPIAGPDQVWSWSSVWRAAHAAALITRTAPGGSQ